MKCLIVFTRSLACSLFVAGVGLADDSAKTETKNGPAEQAAAAQAEMMAKWEKFATPGKSHEALEPLVGKWKTVTKMFGGGSEGIDPETEGVAEYQWILGGRYLQETFDGELYGMPFHGIGLYGYDNFKKKYTGCWIDSASTTMQSSEGLLDRTGKVLTLYGTMDEWLTGEHDKPVKFVYRIISKDKHVFEIHDLGIVDGDHENTKVIEITYTRGS